MASLQKNAQEGSNREANLGARLECSKQQWAKVETKLEALIKDQAFLKQRCEHHDATIFLLQQADATAFSNVESLQGAHDKLNGEVLALQQKLSATQKDLNDTRDELGKATGFANNLHSGLQKTYHELHKTAMKLDGLESKQTTLADIVEKSNGNLAELTRDHHKSINSMSALQNELEKTNETLSSARGQLDITSGNLHIVKCDLGRTKETVQKLDQGLEHSHACFTGLQKGFEETGIHIARRPSNLPKIDRFIRSPKAAYQHWEHDDDSTNVSSRRSSVVNEVLA